MAHRIPSMRRACPHGKPLAVVDLTDARTHARRRYYCGPWDSPRAKQRYGQLIAAWLAAGRRLSTEKREDPTVAEVLLSYRLWAEQNYSKGELGCIRAALRVAGEVHGMTDATTFGPAELEQIRNAIALAGNTRGWCNKQVSRLRAAFRWAAERGLVGPSVHHALTLLRPLRRNRGPARESVKVRPPAPEQVRAAIRCMNRQVSAMVQLQVLTAARGGELFRLRPRDIDRRAEVWKIEVEEHKMAYAGRDRTLWLGPQSQAILRPFLDGRPADAYLFSPAEAAEERRSAAQAPRRASRSQRIGNTYNRTTYRNAIARACRRANVPEFRPHQLRHLSLTLVRERFGIEASGIWAGHASAELTDRVYAERDMNRALEIARLAG